MTATGNSVSKRDCSNCNGPGLNCPGLNGSFPNHHLQTIAKQSCCSHNINNSKVVNNSAGKKNFIRQNCNIMEPTDQEAEAKMRHHWTRVQQVKKNLQDNGCVSSNTFAEILLNEGADLLTMLKNNSFMMSSMADSLSEKWQEANTNENNC